MKPNSMVRKQAKIEYLRRQQEDKALKDNVEGKRVSGEFSYSDNPQPKSGEPVGPTASPSTEDSK